MVKGIVNAFDHMEFCLVLHLTNTSVHAKRVAKWQPILLPHMLVLLPTSTPGSKYWLPANKTKFLTLWGPCLCIKYFGIVNV